MRHEIPYANWTSHLADAIDAASAGETIVCHSAAMCEMGESARARMCPEKAVEFENDHTRDE